MHSIIHYILFLMIKSNVSYTIILHLKKCYLMVSPILIGGSKTQPRGVIRYVKIDLPEISPHPATEKHRLLGFEGSQKRKNSSKRSVVEVRQTQPNDLKQSSNVELCLTCLLVYNPIELVCCNVCFNYHNPNSYCSYKRTNVSHHKSALL